MMKKAMDQCSMLHVHQILRQASTSGPVLIPVVFLSIL